MHILRKNSQSNLIASGAMAIITTKMLLFNLSYLYIDRDFILQRQSELQEYINNVLEVDILANNIHTKKFLDMNNYSMNFQGWISWKYIIFSRGADLTSSIARRHSLLPMFCTVLDSTSQNYSMNPCYFRKIVTVSHFKLVSYLQK